MLNFPLKVVGLNGFHIGGRLYNSTTTFSPLDWQATKMHAQAEPPEVGCRENRGPVDLGNGIFGQRSRQRWYQAGCQYWWVKRKAESIATRFAKRQAAMLEYESCLANSPLKPQRGAASAGGASAASARDGRSAPSSFTASFTAGQQCPDCGEGQLSAKVSARGRRYLGCSSFTGFGGCDSPQSTTLDYPPKKHWELTYPSQKADEFPFQLVGYVWISWFPGGVSLNQYLPSKVSKPTNIHHLMT